MIKPILEDLMRSITEASRRSNKVEVLIRELEREINATSDPSHEDLTRLWALKRKAGQHSLKPSKKVSGPFKPLYRAAKSFRRALRRYKGSDDALPNARNLSSRLETKQDWLDVYRIAIPAIEYASKIQPYLKRWRDGSVPTLDSLMKAVLHTAGHALNQTAGFNFPPELRDEAQAVYDAYSKLDRSFRPSYEVFTGALYMVARENNIKIPHRFR
jgi:hypothetical protein